MSRTVKALLTLVFAVVGAITAATPALGAVHSVFASCGDTSGYDVVALSSLPPEASDTVGLIDQGGPFPYPGKDGSVFTNTERILPICARSYHHEYTVPTPGASNRGARRIVTNELGDFYSSFQVIDLSSWHRRGAGRRPAPRSGPWCPGRRAAPRRSPTRAPSGRAGGSCCAPAPGSP